MEASASVQKDEDVSLPRATVYKVVQDMMPPDMTCAKDAKELIIEICNEFIHLIATQSTEICDAEGKKTIGGEHVIAALEKLGFDDYVSDVKAEFEDVKKSQKDREKKPNKLLSSGLSEEELLRQQELLFSQAREKYQQQQQQQQSDEEKAALEDGDKIDDPVVNQEEETLIIDATNM